MRIYQAAGIEYDVPWQVLAAINEIETDYGRNLNVSSAGAMGWMQFIPSSWKAYGVDANDDGRKDPYNPVDAIFAAARYLKAAGAKDDIRGAVFSYNHATWYVDSVMLRAKLIGGLPEALVGAITGLTEGRFPVAARATYADDIAEREALKRSKSGNAANVVESSPTRRGINIYSKRGAPVIAVNDGVIKAVGQSKTLGRFVVLQDVYGNRYTYSRLGRIAASYPSPKPRQVSLASIKRELEVPQKSKDPKPSGPASAGAQQAKAAAGKTSTPAPSVRTVEVSKERLFAHPGRSAAYRNGGEQQLLQGGKPVAGYTTFEAYFKQVLGLAAQGRACSSRCAGRAGDRGHGARAHRQDRREPGAARALHDPPGGSRGPARSTRSRSSTAGSCSRRPRSTAPRARTRSSARRAQPVDRPDHADEQGASSSSASSTTRASRSTTADAATSARARSTGACWPRSSSSPRRASSPRSAR